MNEHHAQDESQWSIRADGRSDLPVLGGGLGSRHGATLARRRSSGTERRAPNRRQRIVPRYAETMNVLVVNGPNLRRLGTREPEKYGTTTHDELAVLVTQWGADLQLDVEVRQSDDEADLVHWMHESVDAGWHVVLNPAAFTHYSYALRDACALVSAANLSLVEVHLTNPHARETFRHTSVISGVATGTIAGFGVEGYRLALEAVARRVG